MAILIKGGKIVNEASPPPDMAVLEAGDDPGTLAQALGRIKAIAVRFPAFGDGRGYSIARLLRERYGYRGELRAIGQVARDNLHFMAQCGFDAFELRAGEDAQAALAAFNDFSETYQATVARTQPLFRRRVVT
ncbi:MAG: DUF934 domain-containing protein [Geminicoccales bacterium]